MTNSPESLEHLKNWIRKYNETHSCRLKDDPKSPTRLIKVTVTTPLKRIHFSDFNDLQDNQVKIVITEGQKGRCTTLSHRWGADETFKQTKVNITNLNNSVPWDSIPRTYQDAIEITRKPQVDYIWIDSLCIIQDDLEDWIKGINPHEDRVRELISLAADSPHVDFSKINLRKR
ncbi:hypothetical protein F5Y10DRAFT_269680 [Nemania abortiva]|nr:hypothetical protein F5Y10DRAFT_269680 [Nemania abortiva]